MLGEEYEENPSLGHPAWVRDMIHLWVLCQQADGTTRLPDAGGPADQSPFVMDCMAILDQANAEFGKATA